MEVEKTLAKKINYSFMHFCYKLLSNMKPVYEYTISQAVEGLKIPVKRLVSTYLFEHM